WLGHMKLVTFSAGAGHRLGIADPEAGLVREVSTLLPAGAGLLDVIERWDDLGTRLAEHGADQPAIPLDSVRLLAPLPVPGRNIFCVGKNYREHAAGCGRRGYASPDPSEQLPDKPIFFSKATTSMTGPYDDIDPHHTVTSELDYEGELAVIIGRG